MTAYQPLVYMQLLGQDSAGNPAPILVDQQGAIQQTFPNNSVTPGKLALNQFYSVSPAAVAAAGLVSSVDFANGTLTIAGQPDVPRNLTGTLTDANSSVSAGVATINYIDINGSAQSAQVPFDTLRAGWTGPFIVSSVTSVVLSGCVGGAAGVDVVVFGFGSRIGLPNPILTASAVRRVSYNGAFVAAPTIHTGSGTSAVDTNAIAAYNGSRVLNVTFNPGVPA